PGVVRRLRVAVDWNLELLFPRDITQIQMTKTDHLRVDHYEPGETIIGKNEIGREVFIMERGTVEVFQPAENGQAETVVATLGAGEVFGEKALLADQLRGASVRAGTAVDVLAMSRDDFVAMVSRFPPLDDYFER